MLRLSRLYATISEGFVLFVKENVETNKASTSSSRTSTTNINTLAVISTDDISKHGGNGSENVCRSIEMIFYVKEHLYEINICSS